MRRRVWALLLVVGAYACEESTSGGDRTAKVDAGAEDAAQAEDAAEEAQPDAAHPTDGSTCGESCDAGAALAAAVAHFAQVECAQIGTCDATVLGRGYGDLAGCFARMAPYLTWITSLPGSTITAAALDACADATAALDCTAFLSNATALPACLARGTRANGQGCLDGSQCASGFCPSAGIACAKCAPAPAAGASCMVDTDCAVGTVCSGAGTCAVPVALGQTCSASAPCDRFLACKTTCQPLPTTAGAPCGSATANVACDERVPLVCTSTTSGTCSSLALVDIGASCAPVTGAVRACKAMGTCAGNVCQAAPTAGQACGTNGASCQFPDQCVNARCVSPPAPSSCPP